jgi:pseudaminic acid biosynthesis-associated methylase
MYSTPQEEFWAGDFGTGYIDRNRSAQQLAGYIAMFKDIIARTGPIKSCIELGANVGLNLQALSLLVPGIHTKAVEINPDAAAQLRTLIGAENVHEGSILEWEPSEKSELAFTSGVLIHIEPDHLPDVYDRLYAASSRFVLVAEYYNRSPVSVLYRGHQDRLFKRDFAGELLDRFSDLKLLDYGFYYHRDPSFPRDDTTWFLMEKPCSIE